MNDYNDIIERPISNELNDAKREREILMGDVISQRIKFIDEIKGGMGEEMRTELNKKEEIKKLPWIKRLVLKFIEKC